MVMEHIIGHRDKNMLDYGRKVTNMVMVQFLNQMVSLSEEGGLKVN